MVDTVDIEIFPSRLSGNIGAIASKSHIHRTAAAAFLSDTPTFITADFISEDIAATLACIRTLGGLTEIYHDGIRILPSKAITQNAVLNCGECGSTARFMLPIAAALCEKFTLTGSGGLMKRPFAELCGAMRQNGCVLSSDFLPIESEGRLKSGIYRICGDISSQYITGLLFALPLVCGNSKIVLTTPLASFGYVEMTLGTLEDFGIKIDVSIENGWYIFDIRGSQKYVSPSKIISDGDWSNSAFFMTGGVLGGNVSISGLNIKSYQRDKTIAEILEKFGAVLSYSNEKYNCSGGKLIGCDIDASDIPDLVPIVAVVAAVSEGITRIFNTERLRFKESDRIDTVCAMLNALGSDAVYESGCIKIIGHRFLRGGTVDGAGDHRIIMSAAIASCVCRENVRITGAQAIGKSYPLFFEHFKQLGGKYRVI